MDISLENIGKEKSDRIGASPVDLGVDFEVIDQEVRISTFLMFPSSTLCKSLHQALLILLSKLATNRLGSWDRCFGSLSRTGPLEWLSASIPRCSFSFPHLLTLICSHKLSRFANRDVAEDGGSRERPGKALPSCEAIWLDLRFDMLAWSSNLGTFGQPWGASMFVSSTLSDDCSDSKRIWLLCRFPLDLTKPAMVVCGRRLGSSSPSLSIESTFSSFGVSDFWSTRVSWFGEVSCRASLAARLDEGIGVSVPLRALSIWLIRPLVPPVSLAACLCLSELLESLEDCSLTSLSFLFRLSPVPSSERMSSSCLRGGLWLGSLSIWFVRMLHVENKLFWTARVRRFDKDLIPSSKVGSDVSTGFLGVWACFSLLCTVGVLFGWDWESPSPPDIVRLCDASALKSCPVGSTTERESFLSGLTLRDTVDRVLKVLPLIPNCSFAGVVLSSCSFSGACCVRVSSISSSPEASSAAAACSRNKPTPEPPSLSEFVCSGLKDLLWLPFLELLEKVEWYSSECPAWPWSLASWRFINSPSGDSDLLWLSSIFKTLRLENLRECSSSDFCKLDAESSLTNEPWCDSLREWSWDFWRFKLGSPLETRPELGLLFGLPSSNSLK